MIFKKIALGFIFFFITAAGANTVNFVIVIPSYNNEKWCTKNLDSVFFQDYPHFRVIYINDASKDRTGELVQAYIREHKVEDRCMYIENETNRGALYNVYHAGHLCEDREVMVIVDGDDWLKDSQVLNRVSQEYQNPDVWLTYGNFITTTTGEPDCCGYYDPEIIRTNSFRKAPWRASHLRTFYAKLFKLIKYKDLQYKGTFFKVTGDLAIMFPMLEMAQERFRFISDILYIYNMHNPLNDFKLYEKEQVNIEQYIRMQMIPYDRLDKLFE